MSESEYLGERLRRFMPSTWPVPMRKGGSRAVHLLTAILLVAVIAVIALPQETKWLSVYVSRKRNGCTSADAFRAISDTVRQRRMAIELSARSRVLLTDPAGYVLWQTPVGRYWAPQNEAESFLFVLAELELAPYSTGPIHVSEGDVVLDLGAHVGTFTRQALTMGAKIVVAVEPGEKQVGCLRRNFTAEIAAGRLIVFPKGVGDREGTLTFHTRGTATDTFVSGEDSGPTQQIPVTTIDAIVAELQLAHVDFIKMDIEGFEQQALAGAVRTLSTFKPRLAIAAYHRADDASSIPAIVARANQTYRSQSVGCRLDLPEIRPLTMFFR